MQSGWLEIYVNTFKDSTENFIDKLPSHPMKSTWYSTQILPINYNNGKEILILKNDRKYCTDCYYIIGVKTIRVRAKFTNSCLKATRKLQLLPLSSKARLRYQFLTKMMMTTSLCLKKKARLLSLINQSQTVSISWLWSARQFLVNFQSWCTNLTQLLHW